LNEILSPNARKDIDVKKNLVRIGRTENKNKPELLDMYILLDFANEINEVLNNPKFSGLLSCLFKIDPGGNPGHAYYFI